MARARNRVGVEADSGEAGLQVDGEGVKESNEDRTAPGGVSELSLEEKKLKKQKELLKKKKAERRAHAKKRKELKAQDIQVDQAREDGNGIPLLDYQDRKGTAHIEEDQYREDRCGQNELPEALPDGRMVVSVALQEEKEQSIVPVDMKEEVTMVNSPETSPLNQDSDKSGHSLLNGSHLNVLHTSEAVEIPRSIRTPTPSTESNRANVLPLHIEEAPRDSCSDITQQQKSAASLLSEAATLSVDESDAHPQHEVRIKRTKKPSPSPLRDQNANQDAARTIQKAFKKRILRQTKKTFQKAKSLIRSSSKILVDEPAVIIDQPQATRQVVIPPLDIKPREPLPSSPPSSDTDDNHSSASSSRGSFTNRNRSRPSSCSSPSCSSRSDGSASPSSTDEDQPRRTSSQRRKCTKSNLNLDGPSAELLLPPMPKKSVDSKRQFGELHHYMATRIQARVRGIRGRSIAAQREAELEEEIRLEALQEIQEEASVRIQAHVKGFLERRRLGLSTETMPNRKKLKKVHHHSHHSHPHTKHNSIMPQCMANACAGDARPEDTADEIANWPEEFNLEPLDDWEELNREMNAKGETVSTSQFISRGKVRVFCGTWNLHAKKPKEDLRLWIPLNRYHVVAIGTEECVNSIAKSVVFTSKKQWENQLKETLGDEYVLVAAHSLTAIHNAVFVHESVLPYVQNIQSDAVATGLGNQLGNKGGVGIAFSIGHTSLAFVNCHFDAHQQNVAKRNANFHRINQELQLTPIKTQPLVQGTSSTPQGLGRSTTSRFSSSASSGTAANAAGSGAAAGSFRRRKLSVSESFDRVFWFGDLNYRINGTRRMIDLLLLHNQHAVLRFNDQLRIEMHKGNVFAHFQEGPLHFRPTYKFDKHSNVYDSGPKQRIPSWTDRILYLSNEKPQDIELLSYRSHMAFQSSDHRPVGAVFQVNFGRGPTTQQESAGSKRDSGGGQDFARVLAKGYKANQTRSEVCVVQ